MAPALVAVYCVNISFHQLYVKEQNVKHKNEMICLYYPLLKTGYSKNTKAFTLTFTQTIAL